MSVAQKDYDSTNDHSEQTSLALQLHGQTRQRHPEMIREEGGDDDVHFKLAGVADQGETEMVEQGSSFSGDIEAQSLPHSGGRRDTGLRLLAVAVALFVLTIIFLYRLGW